MKKILLYLAGAAATLSLVGCEGLLDIPQKGVVSIDDFYKTDEDAQSALTAAYSRASCFYVYNNTIGWNDSPHLAVWSYPSDDIYAAGNNASDNVPQQEMNSFRFDNNNGNVTAAYQSYYVAIYAANLVIDNFDGEKADSPIKKKCVAEARILRAHAHLMLALGWGTPPIIDHVIPSTEKPANSESQAQVLKWVANECDLAMPVLDERESVNDKNGAVKVTKAFAQGIKGKALLSLKDWKGAREALKPIVDARDKYELVPSDHMVDLFHLEGDGCSESIFEFNLVWASDVPSFYDRAGRNQAILWNWRMDKMRPVNGMGSQVVNNGWGEVNPTRKFIETLLANDGINSARRKAWVKSYDEVLYEMPYLSDATATTKELKEKDTARGIYAGDGLYGHCGWFMWKRNYRPSDLNPSNQRMYNFPIMRLPEVLLMYAECCAQTGTDLGKGLDAILEIQKRAGIPAANYATECTLDVVKKEKKFELFTESCRFADCVRWGDTAGMETAGTNLPTLYDHMFDADEATRTDVHSPYVKHYEYNKEAEKQTGFQKGKHELFPFPTLETSINPNIVQNPGW